MKPTLVRTPPIIETYSAIHFRLTARQIPWARKTIFLKRNLRLNTLIHISICLNFVRLGRILSWVLLPPCTSLYPFQHCLSTSRFSKMKITIAGFIIVESYSVCHKCSWSHTRVCTLLSIGLLGKYLRSLTVHRPKTAGLLFYLLLDTRSSVSN